MLGCLGGLYELTNGDGMHVFCRARGAFRHEETQVLVGDIVRLHSEKNEYAIEEVMPRKNALIRPRMANLDTLVAVVALAEPLPTLETLDKLLAICAHSAIEVTVVLTKCELVGVKDAAALASVYERAGYPVFCLSSYTGEGLPALNRHIDALLANGGTLAFAGASGVGKSTLLNALFPTPRQETGTVSEKLGRGRHTTRSVNLFAMRGGYVADTPGFSMLDFLRFDFFTLKELPLTFPEVARHALHCRYADCTHRREAECAVRAAVENGAMARSRYESYCALYDVLKEKKKNAYK